MGFSEKTSNKLEIKKLRKIEIRLVETNIFIGTLPVKNFCTAVKEHQEEYIKARHDVFEFSIQIPLKVFSNFSNNKVFFLYFSECGCFG